MHNMKPITIFLFFLSGLFHESFSQSYTPEIESCACLMALPLNVTARSGAPTNDFTGLQLFNQHRFSSSALAPVCKSRRLYPGCS